MRQAGGTIPWRRGQSDMPFAGMAFITGLAAEARILRGLGYQAFAGGGTPDGAAACAEAAIADGALSLVSFGLAGGLDPAVASGAAIRSRQVAWEGRVFDTDAVLTEHLGGATCNLLLATTHIVAGVIEKQRLWAKTGAAAVDMESGAVAAVAARHGVSFAVLRAICDPAGRTLPPAALAALDPTGRIGFLSVAGSVMRHPGQIPALIALAADAGRARRTLISQVKSLARLSSLPA